MLKAWATGDCGGEGVKIDHIKLRFYFFFPNRSPVLCRSAVPSRVHLSTHEALTPLPWPPAGFLRETATVCWARVPPFSPHVLLWRLRQWDCGIWWRWRGCASDFQNHSARSRRWFQNHNAWSWRRKGKLTALLLDLTIKTPRSPSRPLQMQWLAGWSESPGIKYIKHFSSFVLILTLLAPERPAGSRQQGILGLRGFMWNLSWNPTKTPLPPQISRCHVTLKGPKKSVFHSLMTDCVNLKHFGQGTFRIVFLDFGAFKGTKLSRRFFCLVFFYFKLRWTSHYGVKWICSRTALTRDFCHYYSLLVSLFLSPSVIFFCQIFLFSF